MPSTPTPRLRVMQQGLGENINAWGDPNLNNALQRLEEGQAKVLTLVITGDVTLSVQNYVEDQARSAVLVMTGTPSAAFKVTIPGAEKPYLVDNRTGQVCTIGTAAGAAASVRAGVQNTVFCNGADTTVVDTTLDKVRKATAPVDMNGQRIVNVSPATADTDAPNFGQINQAVTTATNAASAASGSATSASNSATASSNSAAAAQTARNGAEAAYDSFDDRYLGAKSTGPTVDNDGDPLIVGALYFSTTANEMRVWNGSAWQAQVPDAANYVPNTRQISTSNGISGGGTLASDRTLSLNYATQAEGEAGTISNKPMHPLGVRQAIAAQSIPGRFEAALLHVRDEKAANSSGGTGSANTWNVRDLNTILSNQISATLSSNIITLSAGSYFIDATAPANVAQGHSLRLWDVTSSASLLTGTSHFSGTNTSFNDQARLVGRFTVSASKQVRLEHYIKAAGTNSLGIPTQIGGSEVFADLRIWKVA